MTSDAVKSHVTKFLIGVLAYFGGRWHLTSDQITLIALDGGAVAAFVYGVYAHWNMKKVPEAAKVIGGMFLLVAVAALSVQPAAAADLKAPAVPYYKAPVLTPCTVTSCTGWFLGANVGNAGGNLDVVGTGLTGLATNGIMLGVQGGYEFWNGQIYAAVRAIGDWDVQMNSTIVPGTNGLKEQFSYGVVGSAGYSLASAFGLGTTTPGAPQVTLPQQFLQSLMTPYINFGVMKRHGQTALVSGAGMQALIATNWTIDADYFHFNYQGGTASSPSPLPTSQTTENLFMVSINRHFGF